jgi:Amt family ammonium transporter
MAFAAIWHIIVYCPLAHWVWAPDGWLYTWGLLDFAGGTVIETASGVSAFVLAFWLGKLRGWHASPFSGPGPHHGPSPVTPHNVPYVLLGCGLLWFGWFGFNSGSAISSGHLAGRALVNTHLAAAVGLGAWNLLEIIVGSEEGYFKGKATSVGAASGVIVGLVAITPACGYVPPMWAMFIAAFTTPVVFLGLKAIKASGVDDRLDVLGFHGISGMVGTALTGLFASKDAGSPTDGAFYGGGGELFSKQLAGITVAITLSSVGTTVIFWFLAGVAKLMGTDMRIPPEHARDVDASQHGEKAYFTAVQSLRNAPYPKAVTGASVSAAPSGGVDGTGTGTGPTSVQASGTITPASVADPAQPVDGAAV